MRGELPIASDGFLVRPVSGVRVDDTSPALNVRNHDPIGLNEVVADESCDSDHVGSKAVPDIGACRFEDAFKITTEGTIDIGAGAPRVGGVEHPAEADVVLLVVENRSGGAQTARREHGACHKFEGDSVFNKDFGNGVTSVGIGHGGESGWGVCGGQDFLGDGRRAALLHLGKDRGINCE